MDNRPSLETSYVGGGYLNNSGRHHGAYPPDSPSAYSQLTTATRRDEEEEEDPDAPIIIRVVAPATLPEGYTIDVLYNDEPHTVDIPRGGVREGEEFETVIDPKRKYREQHSTRRMTQMDQLAEEEEDTFSRRNNAYSRDESQRDQRRDSQRSGNSVQQRHTSKLHSAKLYNDDGSVFTNDTMNKTKDIEQSSTFPASLSGDEETMMEKTHIQNKQLAIVENKGDDAEGENKDKVWYDKNGTPHGKWRTRLFSCCDVLTQSTFWMGLICAPVLMAQLITRMGLTWNGREGPPEETSLSYNRIVLGLVFIMSLYWIPVFGTICVSIYYLVVVVYIGSQVRRFMRQKYSIPSTLPTRCGNRIDDACMMFWCGCCSSIQMARHTHDDKDYPGHACTTTGLEFNAPSVV
ncbi:unnamed protein product [Pseudo-nitzschia multistriata]|uniref:PLAC8 family protein n=1 Tax=Pseudo-nitzschia multistriata TaxID=183589 RepID=A0A448Z161_9STRA|nr:unnamed protein product [Pseudo-nitzschia multistriata]